MNLNKQNMIRMTKVFFEFTTKKICKNKKIDLCEKIVNKKNLLFVIKRISLFNKKRKILNRYIFRTFVARNISMR